MKYAVIKGTISCNAIHDKYVLKENEVLFEGDITENTEVVWDSTINNVRFKNADDLVIEAKQLLKEKIDVLTSNKIAAIFGYPQKSLDLVIRQLNLNTQIAFLQNESKSRILTAGEEAIIAKGAEYFLRIVALRMHGAVLSNQVDACDPTTFDINVGWPE